MKKVTLLFPGQGVQYAGMGRYTYDRFLLAKQIFEEAEDVCGFPLKKLCFEPEKEQLAQTKYTQPALLTVGYSYAKVLMEEYGYQPELGAGHSLGEITALTVAGGLTFQDAIKFVTLRGHLMQEAANRLEGSMSAVIGIDSFMVKQLCEEISNHEFVVEVSNYNTPMQTVISGHTKAVEAVENRLKQKNVKTVRLNVGGPFHSSLMKNAANELSKELKKFVLHSLKFPVLSNVTGMPHRKEARIKDLLVLQLTHSVEWIKTMKFLNLNGTSDLIDVGPGNTVARLVSANGCQKKSFVLEGNEDTFFKELKEDERKNFEVTKDGAEFIRNCMGVAISTKNSLFQVEEYQKYVKAPYLAMKERYDACIHQGKTLCIEDITWSWNLLKDILKRKQVTAYEGRNRLEVLLQEANATSLFCANEYEG